MPPSFFVRAQSVAPQKYSAVSLQTFSARIMLHSCVVQFNSRIPAAALVIFEIKSFMCCGRIPSIPPADPFLKLLIALRTSFSDTTKNSSGGSGKSSSLNGDGCFSSNFSNVSVF